MRTEKVPFDTSVSKLGLPVRVARALERNDYPDIVSLAESYARLNDGKSRPLSYVITLLVRGIGPKYVDVVIQALADAGWPEEDLLVLGRSLT